MFIVDPTTAAPAAVNLTQIITALGTVVVGLWSAYLQSGHTANQKWLTRLETGLTDTAAVVNAVKPVLDTVQAAATANTAAIVSVAAAMPPAKLSAAGTLNSPSSGL